MLQAQKNNITTITDKFLQQIYDSGYWSIWVFVSIIVILQFNGCFINYSVPFTTSNVPFKCISTNMSDLEIINNICSFWNPDINETIYCNSKNVTFVVNKDFMHSSIISDYNLVCENKDFVGVTQSCLIFGLVIGGIIGPIIGDLYGRKIIMMAAIFVSGVLGVIIGVLPLKGLVGLAILKFFLGVCREISLTNGFVMALEFLPSKKQTIFGMANQIIWALMMSLMSLLAFIFREWRDFQIVGSIPAVCCLFLHVIVSESPRWLVSRNRINSLHDVVNRYVKRFNNVESRDFEEILNEIKANDVVSRVSRKKLNPTDIFKSKYLIIWTIISIINWVYCAMGIFTLNSLLTKFPGNPFLIYFISSLLDICGILFGYLLTPLSRNISLLILQIISFLCLISSGFMNSDNFNKYISTSLLVVGKMTLLGTVFIVATTSIYIYPSSLRIVGSAIPTTIGKMAAMSTPFIVQMYYTVPWFPTTFIGIFSLFIGFVNLFYPDWLNMPIPETIDDAENLRHHTTFEKIIKALKNNN